MENTMKATEVKKLKNVVKKTPSFEIFALDDDVCKTVLEYELLWEDGYLICSTDYSLTKNQLHRKEKISSLQNFVDIYENYIEGSVEELLDGEHSYGYFKNIEEWENGVKMNIHDINGSIRSFEKNGKYVVLSLDSSDDTLNVEYNGDIDGLLEFIAKNK